MSKQVINIREEGKSLLSCLLRLNESGDAQRVIIRHRYSRKDLVPMEYYCNDKGDFIIEVQEES